MSLSQALGRWRGPAYDGVDQPSVRQAAVELDELRLDTVEEWAEAALAVGVSADVAETLAPEVVRHPLRERLRGLLMKALHDTGRRADALRVFREGRALMAEELGVEPGAPLQALHQELLGDDWPPRSRPTPVPVQLPADLADFTGRTRACARSPAARRYACAAPPASARRRWPSSSLPTSAPAWSRSAARSAWTTSGPSCRG